MKINDSIKKPVGLPLDKSDASPGKKPEATPVGAKAGDSVTLSPMASQLKSLEQKVAAENVYNAEKVSEIKAAISSGQFSVNSEKVADGLIQTVRDLLAKA